MKYCFATFSPLMFSPRWNLWGWNEILQQKLHWREQHQIFPSNHLFLSLWHLGKFEEKISNAQPVKFDTLTKICSLNCSIKKHRFAGITDNFFLFVGLKLHTSLSSEGRLSTTPLPPKNPRPTGQYGANSARLTEKKSKILDFTMYWWKW